MSLMVDLRIDIRTKEMLNITPCNTKYSSKMQWATTFYANYLLTFYGCPLVGEMQNVTFSKFQTKSQAYFPLISKD